MRTFIDDYLQSPSQAIANALQKANSRFTNQNFTEDRIYAELGSPEFRLYQEIIFSGESGPGDSFSQNRDFAVA